jgi:hypothetical protein
MTKSQYGATECAIAVLRIVNSSLGALWSQRVAARASEFAEVRASSDSPRGSINVDGRLARVSASLDRAQLQGPQGLEELASRATALADLLDGHCETEVTFWEGVGDLIIEIVLFLVGLFFTLLGAIDMFGGAAAAALTAGATLVVSALGLVSFIGGLVVTAVSGFLLVKSIWDLINGAEASLQTSVEEMTTQAISKGQEWPILAR